MKKFTIHFHGQKVRAKKNAHGLSEPELVDTWENTIQSNGPAAIWHLTDFVFLRHGIPGARFSHVPSQPGLFRASQPENSRGQYNSRGKYLAQVDVQVTASHNIPDVRIGTLNCPPER